jgi:hypothetical protein
MRVSRLSIGVAAIAAVLQFSAVSVAAQTASPSEPILKPAKERHGKTQEPEAVVNTGVNTGMTKQQRLSLCLGSWDAETHMSKQEWRVACQRTVRDYPDAFVR